MLSLESGSATVLGVVTATVDVGFGIEFVQVDGGFWIDYVLFERGVGSVMTDGCFDGKKRVDVVMFLN